MVIQFPMLSRSCDVLCPRDPNTGEPIEKPGAAGDEASGEAEKVPNLVQ